MRKDWCCSNGYDRCSFCNAVIRTALALRNAALGISSRLAEADAAQRRAALYKAVIDGQKPAAKGTERSAQEYVAKLLTQPGRE